PAAVGNCENKDKGENYHIQVAQSASIPQHASGMYNWTASKDNKRKRNDVSSQ
ncbi:Proline--tRNA ligase, partial [Dissostichus eleginoides]